MPKDRDKTLKEILGNQDFSFLKTLESTQFDSNMYQEVAGHGGGSLLIIFRDGRVCVRFIFYNVLLNSLEFRLNYGNIDQHSHYLEDHENSEFAYLLVIIGTQIYKWCSLTYPFNDLGEFCA